MDSFSGSHHGGSLYSQSQQRWQRHGSGRASFSNGTGRGELALHRSSKSLSNLLAAVTGSSSSRDVALLAHGAGAAATAAASVVADHLDGLLCDLSLFGERDASEVGQELAVANSIQQIMHQHSLRHTHRISDAGASSSSSSLMRRQSSAGAAAAAQLHSSGMKQISGWVSNTLGNTSNWLARSAAAALRSVAGSGSSSQGLLVDRGRRGLPAARSGPAAGAAAASGTLWQYGGSSSSIGAAAAGRGSELQQQHSQQQRRQQPLGKAARRWR